MSSEPTSMDRPEPELRRKTIPLREPQAATSVAPRLAAATSARSARTALIATQGTLALTLPWEALPLATTTGPAMLHEIHEGDQYQAPSLQEQWAPAISEPGPVAVLPDPEEWAARFVQAAMEVTAGLRPASQLIRWTSPEVHEALVRRSALVARAGRRAGVASLKPHVRALLVCTPAPDVCEAAAVVADVGRVRAVAFRMEASHGRWRVTVLDIG